MKRIKELHDGEQVISTFLVNSCNRCVTNQGRTYFNLMLQDSTGTMEAKLWDVQEGDEEIYKPGNLVNVRGDVLLYRDHYQMKIIDGTRVLSSEVDPNDFVPSAPIPKDEMVTRLRACVSSIKNNDIKRLTAELIRRHFQEYTTFPAAKTNHHAFVSGVLYHSLTMVEHAEAMCKIYPELNRDLLIAGCLLHDMGKVRELSGPIATDYAEEGNLLGHISIMGGEIADAAKAMGIEGEVPLLLEHMILSHHGKPEFGSPVMPKTMEALALAMIDDFDAKYNQLEHAYEEIGPGEWTDYIKAMEGRRFYKPKIGN